MSGIDSVARGLAARASDRADRAAALPGLIASKQPLAGDPAMLTVMDAPPSITEEDGTTSLIAGSVAYTLTSDDSWVRWTGAPANGASGLAGYKRSSHNTADLLIAEFISDSPRLECHVLNYVNGAYFRVWVDGQPVQAAAFTTTANSQRKKVLLDWTNGGAVTDDAITRKVRRYRIEGSNLVFRGVYLPADGSVWAPSDMANRKLMAWISDSYGFGTGAGTGFMLKHVMIASRLLGFDHWHDGIGGTGWANADSNEPALRFTNKMAILTRAPDVIVGAMGYNNSGSSQANVEAGIDNWVTAVRARYPAARILLLGPWTPAGETGPLASVKGWIAGRANALGVGFVDISTLVTAANKAAYTGGDNVHPGGNGHLYLARRIADKLAAMLA